MAEEIDDNVFYREDFSVESEWEIFNAQLCELCQKWELSNRDWGRSFLPNELFQCDWIVQEETLKLKGNQVLVAYYKADLKPLTLETAKKDISDSTLAPMHEDLLSFGNTFGPTIPNGKAKEVHWLARFYGLRRFIVLKPRNDQNSYISKRSEFSFYLSAISVVAAEVSSSVPMFVQIYDQKWNFFLGQGITSSMRTNFDLVALEQPPKQFHYLSGLLDMFKQKLPGHCTQPAVVSVCNTYSLETVKIRVPMYVPFDLTPLVDEERSIIGLTYFTALPHGYIPDSRTEYFATFTWPKLANNVIIDSEHRAYFVPSRAHCGTAHQVVHATSYLTSCIKYYHNLITAKNTLESYVGRNFSGATQSSEFANSLDQLTKPHLSKFQIDRQIKQLPGPMTEHELNQMLFYLFPNLYPALFPYEISDLNKDPHRIKSAAPDSLVQRLSCLLATCHAHFGGNSGLAQLWATFTRILRMFWESGMIIPGVSKGFPDTRTCLLHQKLQMLNVCIERRLQRENPQQYKSQHAKDDDDDNDTEEEEFYDCDEDEEAANKRTASPVKGEVMGRLKRLRDLKLLDSEDYLYVPITQDPVPKTEDELQDDADVMLKLGSGSDHVTAMMCSTLQSDAEAFKAANLNAKFEDFIRWYSPNDWEEYEDEQGSKQHKLSPRMKAQGNTWQTVWEEAKPVPVSRQKRLFDDTHEGFKVLHYLETRNLGEIYGLTVVPLLHSAILKLKNILLNAHALEVFSDSLEALLADVSRFSRDIEIVAAVESPSSSSSETHYVLQLPNPDGITRKIEQLETEFYQYKCLEVLFETLNINSKNIQEKFKEILKNEGMFSLTSEDFKNSETWTLYARNMQDKLISKDYVLRINDGLTSKYKSVWDKKQNTKPIMPHFLRAIVTGEKLRLCGAFTENTTFQD